MSPAAGLLGGFSAGDSPIMCWNSGLALMPFVADPETCRFSTRALGPVGVLAGLPPFRRAASGFMINGFALAEPFFPVSLSLYLSVRHGSRFRRSAGVYPLPLPFAFLYFDVLPVVAARSLLAPSCPLPLSFSMRSNNDS